MKVKVGYPDKEEELKILKITSAQSVEEVPLRQVLTLSQLMELRRAALEVYVDPKIDNYIVSLVQASRKADAFGLQGMIDWGASPRASIALKNCARSLAYIRGQGFVTPDHVKELAYDVLRHRILLSYEAEARALNSDDVIRVLLNSVSVP